MYNYYRDKNLIFVQKIINNKTLIQKYIKKMILIKYNSIKT